MARYHSSSRQRFRPLSWGLSFNIYTGKYSTTTSRVFVPFLGDFLSMNINMHNAVHIVMYFRPLSWGLSFNISRKAFMDSMDGKFSSPFLGTFFQ